jgi:HAD superfamily phosphatase (TIGR01668 family)
MPSFLTPHLRLNRVLELEVAHLRSLGLDGLLLDIDCTLKDFVAPEIGPEVVAWLDKLRGAGVRLCLVSNGKARRIEPIARKLDLPFVAKAIKPLPGGCHRALKMLGLQPGQAAMMGDQLFADILAGRLAGLFTILVKPTSLIEPWFTRLKRPPERLALRWMHIPTLDDLEKHGADLFPGRGGHGSGRSVHASAVRG